MSNHASTYHRLTRSNIFDFFEDGHANLPTIAEIRRMIRKARAQSARDQSTKSRTPKAQITRAKTARSKATKPPNSRAQTTQRLAPRPQPAGQSIRDQAAQTQPKEATALGPLTNMLRGASWRRDPNEDP